MSKLRERLLRTWYSAASPPWGWRLLSWLFALIVWLRRLWLQSAAEKNRLPIPVIVIGNITVGGSGKTPFVIWLAERLREWGWRPGIVSRGYGGRPQYVPRGVSADSSAEEFGDEPVLMAQRLGCPVVVSPDRLAAAQALVQLGKVNIILSDDGLQHYRLPRDIEIVVVDAARGLGNGCRLPAGPLRESARRLRTVDLVAINGSGWSPPLELPQDPLAVRLGGDTAKNLSSGASRPLSAFAGQTVHAVAGIGHPVRFFAMLSQHGIQLIVHPFADHHAFSRTDLAFDDALPILMTEKDAVKCREFANARTWCVPVNAEIGAVDTRRVQELISALKAKIA